MAHTRERPPTEWVTGSIEIDAGSGIYALVSPEANPIVWHWCLKGGGSESPRWVATATDLHELVSRDPLHLEPSLATDCCDLHGWIRDGRWVPA